jgi:hypothetical protein
VAGRDCGSVPSVPPFTIAARTGGDPPESGRHRARDSGARDSGARDDRAPRDPRRRSTVILRYLLGRLAIDHARRLTVWVPAVPVAGSVLLLVQPRWIGGVLLGLGVLLVGGRVGLVRLLRRISLPRQFRPVETALRDAVEAGKANLRVELRRAGLPSRSWQVPVYVLRLARGTGRATTRARLRDVDVDLVLPRAQLDRAARALDEAGRD